MNSDIKDNLKYSYKTNFVVIEQKNSSCVPLFCPVCKFLMTGIEDIDSFKNYKCCNECALNWAEANSIAWLDKQWRPTQAVISEKKKKRIESMRNLTLNH